MEYLSQIVHVSMEYSLNALRCLIFFMNLRNEMLPNGKGWQFSNSIFYVENMKFSEKDNFDTIVRNRHPLRL